MNPLSIGLSVAVLASAVAAQLPPTFFTSGFHGGFQGFTGFGSPQIVGTTFPGSPSSGSGGRSNTGTTVQGPILFPPAPESRDTSGVIVGASGYGFVPPGVNDIVQGRGFPSAASTSSSSSQSVSPFHSALRQSLGSYFL